MSNTKTAENKIIVCLSGVELLQNDKLQPYLIQIRNLVSCPNNLYKQLYLFTLYRLAEFCQAMPFTDNEFTNNYGFLERQLKLATNILKLRRGILLPKNANAEQISAEEVQWTYALFSAILLKDLYLLQSNRETFLHDNKGEIIRNWIPLSGSLYEQGTYYSMEFASKNISIDTDVIMAGLSGRIIPADACIWLSSNSYLFKHWWNSILQQNSPDNPIETIIQLTAEKSNIALLHKSNKADEINLLEVFKNELMIHANSLSENIIKTREGLFVSDRLFEKISLPKIALLEELERNNWLILHEGKPYHDLYPKKYEDKRTLHGIILNIKNFPDSIQALPNNDYFQKRTYQPR